MHVHENLGSSGFGNSQRRIQQTTPSYSLGDAYPTAEILTVEVTATEFQLSCGHRRMQGTSNFPDSEEASQTPWMTSCDGKRFHLLPGNCDGKDLDAGHRLSSESALVFSYLILK